MAEVFEPRGMGWIPDPPDIRDFVIEVVDKKPKATLKLSLDLAQVPRISEKMGGIDRSLKSLKFPFPPPPKHLKNLQWCSPVEDQKNLGSCTAQAGMGLLEYFERRSFGKHIDGSRLFLYKVTRNLLGWTGDTGAYCRTTMGGLALFGAPPEKYWPYVVPDFDKEPASFLYAFAQNYQGLIYHRLDRTGTTSKLPLLTRIKVLVAVGWPLMFGFSVYSSISQAATNGEIPYPVPGERRLGGHAIVAVGYDDKKKIKNNNPGGKQTTGAFLIRNSWGTTWGCVPPDYGSERGYGWLPYEYVKKGLAVDWWSLTKAEWIDTGQFGV